ncbi:ComEC/Rec2 family competence protein [Alkalihalophilus marmarensis]|uniref:Competence protein n=2 Tax=Alkalihalophilus TaxID=2893060 RepID=U6SL76_9BACI|nr:ComEC/Rec2 family competence protein [Alkalihalophilus marmarensis]ERN52152.1 competence protein [Alkalihalophilus marmarensis DSM 21297]
MTFGKTTWVKIALVFTFILTLILSTGTSIAGASSNLQVHFIDVGQGDAILVKLPNGEHMLVDAGDNHYGETVVNYIQNQNIASLDYVVGTHPHADHIGGLDDVINRFLIGEVYLPNATATTQTYYDVLTAIDQKGLSITRAREGLTLLNTTVDGKNLSISMIAPIRDSYSNINDYSAVIRIVYGSTSFLLTGDAEHLSENDMLSSNAPLASSILKVGHHGSSTSTTASFLDRVNPSAAIISVGANNRYGHPNQSTIDRLQARGISIYRTDLNGSIVFTTSGSGWLVNKQAWWRP